MISETLDRLDEKFLTNPRSKMSYLNGDEKRELVKFVEEEIKLAREETLKELIREYQDNELDGKGYDFYFSIRAKIDELNKLKKYETIRNI